MVLDQNKENNQFGKENELRGLSQGEQEQRALADALFDVAEAINSTFSLDEVLRRILVNVGKVVSYDAANIMLVENDICRTTCMQGYERHGTADQVASLVFKVSETANLQSMLESRKPLAIENTSRYPGWVQSPFNKWVQSYAGAPIMIKGQISGFLNLVSAVPGFYKPRLAETLMLFANQCGIAINLSQLFERVQRLDITDDLTHLYNRRGLFTLGRREVDRAARFSHPLCALMLDIDNFKHVNEEYSRKVGDEVLRIVAERLLVNVREVDIIGRYGDDQFIILLVENNLPAALQVAERLRNSIEERLFETSMGKLSLTISIGVTAFSMDMVNLETFLDRVGQDLHAARQAGKNQVSTSPLS